MEAKWKESLAGLGILFGERASQSASEVWSRPKRGNRGETCALRPTTLVFRVALLHSNYTIPALLAGRLDSPLPKTGPSMKAGTYQF